MGSLTKFHKLPIIDFTKENIKPNTESWSKVCQQVICALENYGCFVASYPQISIQLHNSLLHGLEELFLLPTQTKMQNKSDKPLYGYVGQIPFIPLYESMGIDYANTQPGIQNFTNLMWPKGNIAFRYDKFIFHPLFFICYIFFLEDWSFWSLKLDQFHHLILQVFVGYYDH